MKTKILKYWNIITSNRIVLFSVLLLAALIFLFISFYYNHTQQFYISSIYVSLFVAFIQIIITVFIIEKVIERNHKNEWKETLIFINSIIEVEIRNGLADVVYMADFSEYRKPHCYLESRLEKNLQLENNEVIHAGQELMKDLKLDDFPDHNKNKKGDDEISYQLHSLDGFVKKLEQNLETLDRIVQLYQIKMPRELYSLVIQCRTAYYNLINHSKEYEEKLSASEITGSLIEWNLNFELKHKKGMYDSIIKIIDTMIITLNYIQSLNEA
jgi:hypothetical protein